MIELVLRWSGGELDLMGWNESDHGDFLIEALADGTEWGNPEPVRRVLRRYLLDGSRSVKEYDDNRTIPLKLRVHAADGNALAGGEAALTAVDGRRCELVWTPPDEFSAPAVFVVDSADLNHNMDDLGYGRGELYYTLTLTALPYAFSDEYVTVPAVAQSVSTPTSVDTCASLTGWSSPNATLSLTTATDDATVIKALRTGAGGIQVTRTGTVSFSTQPYMALKAAPVPSAGPVAPGFSGVQVQATVAGPWLTVGQSGTDAGRALFNVGAVASSVVAIRFTYTDAQVEARFFQIDKQATPRSVSSRQQVRASDVAGSMRTTGSMLVESTTAGLGTTVVYTGPDYDPSWSSGFIGSRSTLSSNISGGFSQVAIGGSGNPLQFQRPIADIPAGEHVIWARLLAGGAGTLTIIAQLRAPNWDLLAERTLAAITLGDTGGWLLRALATVTLPDFGVPAGSSSLLRLQFHWSGAAYEFDIDELLTFMIDGADGKTRGSLTVAEVGGNKKLWIDSPSLDRDTSAAYAGSAAKTDARPLSLLSELPGWPGTHALNPPRATAYVATLGATDATASWTFRPAHHTHPVVVS